MIAGAILCILAGVVLGLLAGHLIPTTPDHQGEFRHYGAEDILLDADEASRLRARGLL